MLEKVSGSKKLDCNAGLKRLSGVTLKVIRFDEPCKLVIHPGYEGHTSPKAQKGIYGLQKYILKNSYELLVNPELNPSEQSHSMTTPKRKAFFPTDI